jgi:hypothetical protein
MARRRLVTVGGFVSGAVAAALAYRRWLGDRRERIDVYFGDGSFVTHVEGSSDADGLLSLAHDVLAAATSET